MMPVTTGCRSFISIIFPGLPFVEMVGSANVSILYKYHISPLLEALNLCEDIKGVDPL